jgi:hypothetical protein
MLIILMPECFEKKPERTPELDTVRTRIVALITIVGIHPVPSEVPKFLKRNSVS